MVGEVAVTKDPPAPDTTLHEPVPIVGALAAMVVEVPQSTWSGPAAATVGDSTSVTATSSVEGVQDPLEMVHLKV